MAQKSVTEFFHELSRNLPEALIENVINLFYNRIGNTSIKSLGYTSGNTGQRIGVPAQRDRRSDGIHKTG